MFRSLRTTDLIVVGIVFIGVIAGGSDLLGVRDPIATAFLAFALTCAVVRRLAAWRRLERPELRFPPDGMRLAALSFVAFAPWQILFMLRSLHIGVIAPVDFPIWLRIGGAGLTLIGTARPFWKGTVGAFDSRIGLYDAAGLFLVTASPIVGLLAASELLLETSPFRSGIFYPAPETSLR